MDKKYGIFYNSQFEMLMVAFTSNLAINKIQVQNNLTILKNNEEVVGVNIDLKANDFRPEASFCSENPRVIEFVEDQLKPLIKFRQKPQFLIGKVLTCEAIPKTHLSLCQVEINQEQTLKIVCGAKNVKPGIFGVVATKGTWMPNSQIINPKTICGHQTSGMLCSAEELHLKKHYFNEKGIIELPSSYHQKIGKSFWEEYYDQRQRT